MISPSDPYPGYAALREAGPVQRIIGPDGSPSWLVTRYEDVRHALADPRLSLNRRNALPGQYRGMSLPPALDANLLNLDPPDHTRLRKLVTKVFTVSRTDALREPIRRTAEELLDKVISRKQVDLIAEYAAPLPISVICDLLGVPVEVRIDFKQWTDTLLTPPTPEAAGAAIKEMLSFFARLIATKRADPGDDLLSDLIQVRDEGDRLSDDELTSLVFLILFAGYENVVHLIGNAVLTLLDNPDQLQRVREHGVAGAIEELTRYESPAPLAIRRFPREDLTIGGVAVPAGEAVLLGIASTNRDPDRFDNPHLLDLDRAANQHLSYGHGIHHCLGAPLARLEVTVALQLLLDRAPALTLAVPREALQWRDTIRVRGLVRLPIRF